MFLPKGFDFCCCFNVNNDGRIFFFKLFFYKVKSDIWVSLRDKVYFFFQTIRFFFCLIVSMTQRSETGGLTGLGGGAGGQHHRLRHQRGRCFAAAKQGRGCCCCCWLRLVLSFCIFLMFKQILVDPLFKK